jgi:hypothetical protein
VHPLGEFLLVRIAEDRAALKFFDDRFGFGDRWVAECDTRRRIVELVALGAADVDSLEGCEVLLRLAAPHTDHPDYRESWRLRTG